MELDVRKVAIDAVKGIMGSNYSKEQTSEALRNAFVEMNGGSTKINPRTFVRGNALFALVEELIPVIVEEGLKEDNPLFNLVDYKNIKDGDENEFYVEDNGILVASEMAGGIQSIRRQRLGKGEKIAIKTSMKGVKVYDVLNRFLAGRIDYTELVDKTAKAMNQKVLSGAYDAISGIGSTTAGLDSSFVVSGTFNEESLVDLVSNVEASTGKVAKIFGTKSALRKISTAEVSNEAKSALYNLGFYGKFNGTDLIELNQAFIPGTKTRALDDSKLYIIAGDDKPIKVVNAGEGILIEKTEADTNDLTREYIYGQEFGVGVICAEQLGIYTIA